MTWLRWLVAMLILSATVTLCGYALYERYRQPPFFSHREWQSFLHPPAPSYVPDDFLEKVVTQAGLSRHAPSSFEELRASLDALAQLVRLSPWTKEVSVSTEPSPRLLVKWVRVVPVLFVPEPANVSSDIWLAGENLVWLRKVSDQFIPAQVNSLPVYVHFSGLPQPEPMSFLPKPVARSVLLSVMLSQHQHALGLQKILLGNDPVTLDLKLQTLGGSQILWETLDDANSEPVSDQQKLDRLWAYVAVWQSLDKPSGPYLFDNRARDCLLRRPLK